MSKELLEAAKSEASRQGLTTSTWIRLLIQRELGLGIFAGDWSRRNEDAK